MNKHLLAVIAGLLAFGGVTFAQNAAENEPVAFSSVADTWLNEGNVNENSRGNKTTIETRVSAIKDGDVIVGYNRLVGLVGFDYQLPAGKKVQSAHLYLVTERRKGSDVYVYGYSNDFAENTSWANEQSYLDEAFGSTPVSVFTPAGQGSKAIFDNINDNYKVFDKWVNNIDVTEYVKGLPAGRSRVNFLLAQDNTRESNQNCFYSKEAQPIGGNNTPAFAEIPVSDLLPRLYVTFADDSNVTVDVVAPRADTWIMQGNNNKRGGGANIEIYKYTDETDPGKNRTLYGLMGFNLPTELTVDEYELTSVVLRLTCVFLKQSRAMEIYEYPSSFSEADALFSTEEAHVAAALASDPILSFEVKGQLGKSMGDALGDGYKTADAWFNYIDLTEYVNERLNDSSIDDAAKTSVNLLFSKPGNYKEATKFGTKEAADIENTKQADAPFTFAAKDLQPQLTVTYSKKGDSSGVDGEIIPDEDATPVYYNIHGIRVENPVKGLYIVKQGNSVRKVIL